MDMLISQPMSTVLDCHILFASHIFYERLLDNAVTNDGPKIDGRGAARALHNATRCLREKVSESSHSFLAWVPYIHMGI